MFEKSKIFYLKQEKSPTFEDFFNVSDINS